MANKISLSIAKLRAKIKQCYEQIRAVQNACPHPAEYVRYKYDSSTGNWDRGDDSYWTNVHCAQCDKRWTLEGSVRVDGTRVKVLL